MEIYQKLAEINRKIKPIGKDKKNQTQGFNYRGIDQVLNELHTLFAEHGVIVTQKIINSSREERVNHKGTTLIWSVIDWEFSFIAEDGSIAITQARGEGMDSGDKGSNKALSIALKYALISLFTIPTEALSDPDAESPEVDLLAEATHHAYLAEDLDRLKAIWLDYPMLQRNAKWQKIIKEQKQILTEKK